MRSRYSAFVRQDADYLLRTWHPSTRPPAIGRWNTWTGLEVVTTANGGQAGIDAFLAARAGGVAPALVVTDLGMPYVDGRQVARAIKAVSPHTPVVLLTGWGQRLMAEGDVPPHVDRVLNKPPKLRELRRALTELLGAGQ